MQDQNITLILSNLILDCTLNLRASELPNINPKNQTDLTSLVTGHTGPGPAYPHKSSACPLKTKEEQRRALSLGVTIGKGAGKGRTLPSLFLIIISQIRYIIPPSLVRSERQAREREGI